MKRVFYMLFIGAFAASVAACSSNPSETSADSSNRVDLRQVETGTENHRSCRNPSSSCLVGGRQHHQELARGSFTAPRRACHR